MRLTKWRPVRTLPVLLCAMLLLGACTTTTDTAETNLRLGMCRVFKPIGWSTKDTPETIVGVKSHNAVYKGLKCP